MPKLTKRSVETLAPNEAKPIFLWDDQLPGFGVKVLPGGSRRYVVKYRAGSGGRGAPQRWVILGTHGVITCDQGRELARQALAAVARGEDPQAQKFARRSAPRMREVWARYETEQLPLKKPGTAKDYRQQWRNIIEPEIGSHLVSEVKREVIERVHKRLKSTPYQANRVLALLSKLFNLAEAWGYRAQESNPCRHVEKFKEVARERYLTTDELERVGRSLEELVCTGDVSREAAAAIRLLLLTGARLNEILGCQWDWIDWHQRVILLPDSKTGKKPIFLSSEAMGILEDIKAQRRDPANPFLLAGRSKGKPLNNLAKPWKRVCSHAGLSGVRIHDLRHTAASVAVSRGATLPLVGRLLGHRQPQTTNRYAHVGLDPALLVADDIGSAIGPALGLARQKVPVSAPAASDARTSTAEEGVLDAEAPTASSPKPSY